MPIPGAYHTRAEIKELPSTVDLIILQILTELFNTRSIFNADL